METNPTDVDVTAAQERDQHTDIDPTRTGMGLDENVAGALTYLVGFVTGMVFYALEKENAFVRFHAAQSMATFGLVLVGMIGLVVVGTLVSVLFTAGSTGGFLVGTIVTLALTLVGFVLVAGSFGLWLYLVVRAYQGKTPRIPVAAGIADRLV